VLRDAAKILLAVYCILLWILDSVYSSIHVHARFQSPQNSPDSMGLSRFRPTLPLLAPWMS
jgi:hypothetical protein